MNKSISKSNLNQVREEMIERAYVVIKDYEAGKYDNKPNAKEFLKNYMEKNNIKINP